MIVMKFGGTSVRNREAIERVINIVRGRLQDRPVVVVSALAGVTRALCSIAEEAEEQHVSKVEELMASLIDRHTSLVAELLAGNQALLSQCVSEINSEFASLSGFVHGVCEIGELSPRSYARIVSAGEILSSKIAAAAMNASGLSCRWTDARKMIVTNCRYMSAVPDLEMTAANVKRLVPEAAKGVSAVLTQGFIASSVEGFPSVLGFEGSDYSAAILGMALDAERVEIWTDVDGIRTADPRIVRNTCRIGRLSYEEASEMAFLGARVLHPMTIEPASRRNIPIMILNSMSPECAGTVVLQNCHEDGVKSVALKEDIEYVEITSREIVGVSAMLSTIFREIADKGVRVSAVSVSESCAKLTIETGQIGTDAFVAALRNQFEIMPYHDKAQISVVGRNVSLTEGLADRILAAAGKSRIWMISQSPALLSTSIVVDRSAAPQIAASLHDLLFCKEDEAERKERN